jgi:hypothetical protein
MAIAPRHRFVEFMLHHASQWLQQLFGSTTLSARTTSPQLPQPVQKAPHPIHVNATVAFPPSAAPNGHATVTAPKPHSPDESSIVTVLGTDIQTGQAVTLSLKERYQGLYAPGSTGTGKTTFDHSMIHSDIKQGLGLCLIEPHGDLTRQVIAAMPEERLKDVIYLDITDSQSAFGLNFFECPAGADVSEVAKVASFVMHVFEKVWAVGPETPRLAQVLRNTTRVLIESDMTFAEIPLLLWDDGVREKLVQRVTNAQTKLFWQQYNRRSPRDREELIASTINKCDAYLNEPLIARIVSQSASTIHFRRIMDEGKILLVNLSPQLEEASRLIGAVIIGRLLMAAFSRTDTPNEDDRRPFLLYCDEYQRFATADFATFLAEARKFKIGTTLSNQTLEQLDDANRAAALQAGSLVVFRLSGDDSKVLARSYDCTPPTPGEIVGQEPIRAPVADVIFHLVRRGHNDPRVAKFAQSYLSALEKYSSTKMAERTAASHACFAGCLTLSDLDVQRGRKLLNDCLYRSMSERRADIPIAPLAIYVLATAQGNTMEYVFSPYLKSESIEFFGPHYVRAFRDGMASFGTPAFLTNSAPRFVSIQSKKHQWMAERIVTMLTELRYVLAVLAESPILVDTGQYVPQYRQRSYQDQENLIANELSQLPNFHAKVRLLSGEHTIKTRPSPPLVSEREAAERIRAIKERMLLLGFTTSAHAVEEEVAKRHEALRQRPASVTPPPIHTTGNRRGRTKPPTST